MARVLFKDLVGGFQGKVAKRFDTVYTVRRGELPNQEDKCFITVQRDRNLNLFPYTEAELEQRTKFKEQQAAVNELYADKDNRRAYTLDAHKHELTLRQYFWAVVKDEIVPDLTLDDSGSGPGSGTGGGDDDDPDGGGALS